MAENTHNNALPLTVSYQDEAKNVFPSNLQDAFMILNKHGIRMKRLRSGELSEASQLKHLQSEKANEASFKTGGNASNSHVLSAVSIMEMAEMALSQPTSQKTGDFSNLSEAFGFDSCLVRMHEEDLKRVLWLLDAAEKYSNQQYDQAEELLVSVLSGSHADRPIERVVTFYARDLRERIDVEKGRINLEKEIELVDSLQALIDLKAAFLEREQKLSLPQISHFTAIQTILDTVESAERIHFIDIGVNLGSYWIVLMHALANRKYCRLELLKITAVCTYKNFVQGTGDLLSSFAHSMNLPFVFKLLYTELDELDKDSLELETGEIVAVYLEFCLYSLASCPKSVEALLIRLKNLNPDLMVVLDIEASSNSSAFTVRFKEALFYSSAMFDCYEDCLEQDNHFNRIAERFHFQETICNGVLSDDVDSFARLRKIDFWRDYFASFGMVETELSQPSMDQARLMIREYPRWSCCNLSMTGKTMLIGWNGIPIWFLSAWKFQQDCKIQSD